MEQFEHYGRKRSADGFTDIVFGHFHQKAVMDVGGFWTETVSEDMELVVRMHKHHRDLF